MDMSVLKMKSICSVATDRLQYNSHIVTTQSNVEDKASCSFTALLEHMNTAGFSLTTDVMLNPKCCFGTLCGEEITWCCQTFLFLIP
jgi:hypothetical protein